MTNADCNEILIDFLKKSPPEMWHQVAWNWNWDNGIEPLRWIVEQQECDKGTALLIYWVGGPRYNHQYQNREEVPSYEKDNYDLVELIEDNFQSGFYKNGNFAFDPKNHRGTDWTKEYLEIEIKSPIPEIMFSPTPGATLPHVRFEDGYPPEVLKQIDEIYGK